MRIKDLGAVAPLAALAACATPSVAEAPLSAEEARTIECIARVDGFIARLSAKGPVAGPTWQVRDWWDKRSWDMDETRRERELKAARERAAALAQSDPAAAEAAETACVDEAIAGGAVPGL